MGKRAARTMGLEVDGTDLACYVDNFAQNVTPEAPAVTTFCDDGPRRVAGNYDWNHAISGTADLAPGAVDPTLYGLLGNRGAPSLYAATGGPARPNAPVYGGNVVLGSYQLQHRVGQAATYSGQLLGTGPVTRDVGSSLLVGLVSYWPLDEPSGPAYDAHGTNHLTAINAPVSGTGKVGNARQFNAASGQALEIASNPSLVLGVPDITIACWVWLETLTAWQPFISKGTATSHEYTLANYPGPYQYHWSFGGYGIGTDGYITPTTGAWHLVILWTDQAANTTNMQVDNGTVWTYPGTFAGFIDTGPFSLGHMLATASYMQGKLDEVGIWKVKLADSQRAGLWSAGAGVTYPFVGVP